jgi:hypothetical protein
MRDKLRTFVGSDYFGLVIVILWGGVILWLYFVMP